MSRISCIIPVINEAPHIEQAVERAWRAGVDEVLVVDGGSRDNTREIAAGLECRLLESEPGRALQQNAGAAAAQGDVLFFQHADAWLSEGAARQMTEFLENTEADSGAFRQRIEADGVRYRLLEWGNAFRVKRLGAAYGDQGIFARREAFEAVGGFPTVRLLEDLLLMRALRKRAWPGLLPGPLHISARRWRENGVIRQTLRNWTILSLHASGVAPDRLVAMYPRHDANSRHRRSHENHSDEKG